MNAELNSTDKVPQNTNIRVKSLDKAGRAYATGKRKTSIARVWISDGSGKIMINRKILANYFKNGYPEVIVNTPFALCGVLNKFDVFSTVCGGGFNSQIEAVFYGISKALVKFDPDLFHKKLRDAGFLTRDARIVESKKYGHKKARKSFQFSKR